MNTADRSLAVVDYALRRRFAFIDMEPKIGSNKFNLKLKENGISSELLDKIKNRILSLNTEIKNDINNLGAGFEIGHSFFCSSPFEAEKPESWYDRVVKTEILPLLREYWFDNPDKISFWERKLTE